MKNKIKRKDISNRLNELIDLERKSTIDDIMEHPGFRKELAMSLAKHILQSKSYHGRWADTIERHLTKELGEVTNELISKVSGGENYKKVQSSFDDSMAKRKKKLDSKLHEMQDESIDAYKTYISSVEDRLIGEEDKLKKDIVNHVRRSFATRMLHVIKEDFETLLEKREN